MASKRLTSTEQARIRELHAAGHSFYRIAKELGRSRDAVHRYCKRNGLGFDTSRTANATAAVKVSHKARRAIIIGRLYDEAERTLDILEHPTEYKTLVKGIDGEQPRTLDFIPPVDRRNLLTSIGIALDKTVALEAVDQGQASERGASLLEQLTAELEKGRTK